MKKILIADDHWVTRSGLSLLCSSMIQDCVIDEAPSIESLYLKLEEIGEIDLLILDNFIGDEFAVNHIENINTRYNVKRILMVSIANDRSFGLRALKCGARGFVNKMEGEASLKEAINKVLIEDDFYLKDDLIDKYKAEYIGLHGESDNPFDKLSENEFKIVMYLLKGMGSSEISRELKLALSTVSTYKSRIFNKLRIKYNSELKNLAVVHNLFPDNFK